MELNHFNEWDLEVLIRPELSRLCIRAMTLTCVGGFMSMVVILIFRDNP